MRPNPHYEPSAERPASPSWPADAADRPVGDRAGRRVCRPDVDGVRSGRRQTGRMTIWEAVRDARDAALDLLRANATSPHERSRRRCGRRGAPVIVSAGLRRILHASHRPLDRRARDLHGSGPNLDNLETREERLIIPGIGFSVEPGIYIPGEIGMRSEVNCCFLDGELVVTPDEYQHEMIVV